MVCKFKEHTKKQMNYLTPTKGESRWEISTYSEWRNQGPDREVLGKREITALLKHSKPQCIFKMLSSSPLWVIAGYSETPVQRLCYDGCSTVKTGLPYHRNPWGVWCFSTRCAQRDCNPVASYKQQQKNQNPPPLRFHYVVIFQLGLTTVLHNCCILFPKFFLLPQNLLHINTQSVRPKRMWKSHFLLHTFSSPFFYLSLPWQPPLPLSCPCLLLSLPPTSQLAFSSAPTL